MLRNAGSHQQLEEAKLDFLQEVHPCQILTNLASRTMRINCDLCAMAHRKPAEDASFSREQEFPVR